MKIAPEEMGVFFFFVSKKERKKETQYNQPQSSMLM
jgi:preprotein translocase subunit YajC